MRSGFVDVFELLSFSSSDILLVRLKAYGKSVIKLTRTIHACPLCAHQAPQSDLAHRWDIGCRSKRIQLKHYSDSLDDSFNS